MLNIILYLISVLTSQMESNSATKSNGTTKSNDATISYIIASDIKERNNIIQHAALNCA